MRAALLLVIGLASATAHADDDFAGGTVIFARGAALYRVDARGRGETEIATLPSKELVRALRTDAAGGVLLADIGGTWAWMKLDGSTRTLSDLPCADGPAQLAEDGACVLCRGAKGSIIVNLATAKAYPVDIPAAGARLVGIDRGRTLVWADKTGVWSAPVGAPRKKTQIAPEAPLYSFLPSPDGTRALGVYADEVYTDAHHKKPAELLMGFPLDGQGARRKSIHGGVPVEWSHDAGWVLVQEGGNACVIRAIGGEYKCWPGFTAASIASDGKWALVLGSRDPKKPAPAPKKPPPAKKPAAKPVEPVDGTAPPSGGAAGRGQAPPVDEPEEADADHETVSDVAVAPPSGPLALYRAKLDGPFSDPPAQIVKVIDGAAVWVPAGAAP